MLREWWQDASPDLESGARCDRINPTVLLQQTDNRSFIRCGGADAVTDARRRGSDGHGSSYRPTTITL